MLAELVERSVFPDAPGRELVESFLTHLRETGEPESFPLISTTHPPKDGDIVPLALNLMVPGNRRALWKLAPCPICSATSPKWGRRGTLIWCQNTKAIYAIGPKCYGTLWADGRLDREINRLRRTQSEHENLEALQSAVRSADEQLDWIARHRATAARAAQLHAEFARGAPKIRGAIARALKGSLTAAGQIRGQGFIRGVWKLTEKLQEAERIWLELKLGAVGEELQQTAEELAPRVVGQRLGEVGKAKLAMQHVYDRMNEAAAFLTPANMRALGAWGSGEDAPIRFRAGHTQTRVQFRGDDEEAWDGPLGFSAPGALP